MKKRAAGRSDKKEHTIDRRKYLRYDTELKVYFHVTYDLKTRVKFRVMKSEHKELAGHKYSGLCRNVSVEGLCFTSKKKLGKGDILQIDVYEPIVKAPVTMEAEVCWSRKVPGPDGGSYRTGVRLVSINGASVAKSIHFDKKYKVVWSKVLESLFGTFAAMVRKLKK